MGVLRCDHPDIEVFIHAKDKGDLTNFNISIGVTDAFMEAVDADTDVELTHRAEPNADMRCRRLPARRRPVGLPQGARPRPVGSGDEIHLRPRRAGHPVPRPHEQGQQPQLLRSHRGHQPLRRTAAAAVRLLLPGLDQPDAVVKRRFLRARQPSISTPLPKSVRVSTRMLDNVLDATHWPLERQQQEAANKRRVGLGYTGLGDALTMLRLRYDKPEARAMATRITEFMRDTAYLYSVELAKERGAFPLFNAELYLSGGNFASRLPNEVKAEIRKHGLRNSHLLSIAPTGTISLAFRRQRLERHRTAVLLDLQPQEAHAGRHAQGILGRRLRLAPLQAHRWRCQQAAGLLRHGTGNLCPRRTPTWLPPSPRTSTPRSPRQSMCRPTIPTKTSRIST
jgi:ribonucleoside-diphosphate reductase alpha chain